MLQPARGGVPGRRLAVSTPVRACSHPPAHAVTPSHTTNAGQNGTLPIKPCVEVCRFVPFPARQRMPAQPSPLGAAKAQQLRISSARV
jgi:hypothetical protein